MKDNNFLPEDIKKRKMRVQDAKTNNVLNLNRNEIPFDLPTEIKEKVIDRLYKSQWNLYPPVIDKDLHRLLADYNEVSSDMICTGAGAAMLATSLLNYFALQGKSFIIPQPGFSLYEYHCKTYNIKYKTWKPDGNFQYKSTLPPRIESNDICLIISPNNPTGALFPSQFLEELLQKYPQNLFIADEVYYEFSNNSYTPLVKKYKNLILIRSISKTFSAASLRFGYTIAPAEWSQELRKIFLTFSENLIARESVKTILRDSKWKKKNQEQIQYIKQTRSFVYQNLKKIEELNAKLKVFPSEGNFLLIQFQTVELHSKLMDRLREAGIQVLDTSEQSGLERSIRISIGSKESMQQIIDLIERI